MATTMNLPSAKWFSESEMEEYNILPSYHMTSLVGDHHTLPQSFPSINTTSYNDSSYDLFEEKPLKVLKTHHIPPKLPSSPPHQKRQPSTQILSFVNDGSNTNHSSDYLNSMIFSPKEEAASPERPLTVEREHQPVTRSGNRQGVKRAHPFNRNHSQAQDHILAERRRREKLTQRFVALSAMVPGLKKMDKASVLGDAIKHIKYLQERVIEFEEQKRERSVESVVLVKKSMLILDEESSSPDAKSNGSNSALPEIEVRVSDKDVMIKILCEKQKGHVTKILVEIENLHLSITNSSVLPFGATLDITVIAQKEREFDMELVDIVKNLRLALSKFM